MRALLEHAFVVLLIVTIVVLGFKLWNARRALDGVVVDKFSTEHALNDSTRVLLATSQDKNRELLALYAAAKEMNGKLVAAVAVRVPARDTVVLHDQLPTLTTLDSIRTAAFHDSTFAGTIEGVVTAPPFPAPLGVTFALHVPEFRPQVGFVKVASKYVAVVEWRNQRFTVDAPMYKPPVAKRLVVFGEQLIDPSATLTTRGGLELRLPWGLAAVAVADQRWVVGERPRVNVGVRKVF